VKLGLLALAITLAIVPSALGADPQVDARAYLVADGRSGEVLLARGAEQQVPVASITKLMTVLLALEQAKPEEIVTVGSYPGGAGESTIGLRAGERLTVRDLVEGALVQSANDAAWALAAHVGRGDVSRFVELMNRRAQQLSLTETRFTRPDGLAASDVSSARDVTKLARVAMRKPFIRDTVRVVAASVAGRRLVNWNDLLSSFPRLLGVKTGHTDGAGWSQVAAARGGGVTVYATVLGGPSRGVRNADLAELLTWGLGRFRVVPLVRTDHVYARAKTPYDQGAVDLVAPQQILYAGRVEQRFVERVVAPMTVGLPVEKGRRLGEVRIYDRGRLIARSPLVAARSVSKPGPLGRAGWYAEETMRNIGGWFS
jgi:serine-type D-Ala-D-Ala carboxypeptidase (penicillin-binding protein 5/6)